MTPVVRTWLALFLLVVPCLWFGAEKLLQVLEFKPAPVDRVTRAERRFDPVRESLPSRGTVGYVLKMRDPEKLDWYKEYGFIFAQYTLAPLQVAAGADYDIVIEDYDDGVRIVRKPGTRTAP